MVRAVWRSLISILAACGSAASPKLDGGGGDDDAAQPDIDAPPVEIDASEAAYSHTIAIDGGDDFAGVETFPTTSNGYAARVAWDAQNIYVGYSGPDLDPGALDTATKW